MTTSTFATLRINHPQKARPERGTTISGARKGRGASGRRGNKERKTRRVARRVARSGRSSRSWRRWWWKVRMMRATPRAGFVTIRTIMRPDVTIPTMTDMTITTITTMTMMSITTMSITRIVRRPTRERTNTHNTMTRVTIPLMVMGATGLKALKPLARPLTKTKERMMSLGLTTPRNVRRVS